MIVLLVCLFDSFAQLCYGQAVCFHLPQQPEGDHAIGLDDELPIERRIGHRLDGDFVTHVDSIGLGELLAGQAIDEVEFVAHAEAVLGDMGRAFVGDVLALRVGLPVVGTDRFPLAARVTW